MTPKYLEFAKGSSDQGNTPTYSSDKGKWKVLEHTSHVTLKKINKSKQWYDLKY